MPFVRFLAIAAACICLPLGASATPEPVALPSINHANAQVVVVRPDGTEIAYSPADLEQLPTYRVRTTTPWRTEAAEFEGVLLSDVLAANGLAEADAIMVTAENDFTSTIERTVWETVDVLIATRVDGRPHSRRARGPIQFVIDMDAYANSGVAREEHLVWMAARIEAAQ